MKILIVVFITLLFAGGVYIVLGLAERNDIAKAATWPTVPTQNLETDLSLGSGGKYMKGATSTRGPLAILGILFTIPKATYSYTVNGQTYQNTKSLPPSLTPVRWALFKEELAKRDKEIQHTMDNLSNPEMYKLRNDPNDASLKALIPATPPVVVHYDPANKSNSSLDPAVMKPADTLFWSGIWMLIIGAVGLGLLKFHSSMIAGGPDPELPNSRDQGNWKRY